MTGPNSDLTAMFNQIEQLPLKPVKALGNLLSWARGEQDPDWGDKKRPRGPKRRN